MKNPTRTDGKQTYYLKTEAIMRFFEGCDDKIDTMIKCKEGELALLTTDHELYEAIGSLKDRNRIDINKLVKFLESVDIVSFRMNLNKEKPLLTTERVERLRKLASLDQTSAEQG
ncbi:hypothetical protein COT48_03050 [Candidatus Woesearchaeota archaeon CG08_land_8_20_14_0_20_47_9]|nr:MAG: hypothetical protein AUJ69_03205 [Candidatus Woesearchaeota archaeon CG1_02_47_18]PIN76645.1 MAG: hypothetical protein COV22_00100 [Candidatus Woesearchaeota archaeon CG10_big_fil_rev_8_21_14_0_10_47_5]PIO03904.1 MAG: hypothetical protein COT48_03050 [Candidatus Woesearchaeota archaeon CG08_land_8_20_14_0_20_47_9]HII29691.1 hypothetical protein [Candidatus Woesearchaeota archaeon]